MIVPPRPHLELVTRRALRIAWLAAALAAAPGVALAQAVPPPPPSGFGSLWTGWRDVNASALEKEREAVEGVREDYVAAGADRRRELQNQGRALGERVGEIVREGDCDDGERVARRAGDFALVQAVRAHCRGRDAEPR